MGGFRKINVSGKMSYIHELKRKSDTFVEIENPKHRQTKFYRRKPCVLKQEQIEASLNDFHYDKFDEGNGDTALPRLAISAGNGFDADSLEDAIDAKTKFFDLLKLNGFDSLDGMANAVRNGFVSREELEDIASYQFFEDLFPEKIINAIYDNLASEGYVMPVILVKNNVSVVSSNTESVYVEQGSHQPMAGKLLHRTMKEGQGRM